MGLAGMAFPRYPLRLPPLPPSRRPMEWSAQPIAVLPDGHYSDGRIFGTPALRLPNGQPTHHVQLTEPTDPDCLTLLFAS